MKRTKPYSTLFLDRDGVINKQRPHDYVKSPDEFIFIEGTLEALRLLSPLFDHIVIVTNQRGVGKGVMNMETLEEIHASMLATIALHGGRIDNIYVCTATSDSHKSRKPNIGMALQAKQDFPDIDFSRSIMVGDSFSDMEFARRACIPRFLIGEKYDQSKDTFKTQYNWFPDLLTFAKQLIKDIQA
ncbi:HAD family hydrolase [Parabacteroides sp. GYB001]|uniref:D-glycero-alpha-D-manno-heptose-1,7-bisphosphate 7-phosphatase n=1 Tax=Parabacteroides leei TaxID=2939491 RepID=UPI002016ACF4|nr:HAD family hydrolase [Parabacteroides leei]MCL3853402.1 HAD family hydrolase [Parabacteroides leei]